MAKVYKDLREFLATLEEEGQLVRVKEEVMPEPEYCICRTCGSKYQKRAGCIIRKQSTVIKGR